MFYPFKIDHELVYSNIKAYYTKSVLLNADLLYVERL